MKIHEIKVKGSNYRYSVLIGKDSLNFLAKKIKDVCPKTKKIAIIVDKKIPKKLTKKIQIKLRNYNLLILPFLAHADSPKTKFYDFDDLLINGEYKKPQIMYNDVQSKVKFQRLLKLHKNFINKLRNSKRDASLR